MPRRLLPAAVAAAAAALFAFLPVLNAPFIADDVDVVQAAAIARGPAERLKLLWDFSTQRDWFRPGYAPAAWALFGVSGRPAPHRLLILALIAASALLLARAATPAAGLLYLFAWCHWSTAASIVAVSSAAAQCAFFAGVVLAREKKADWPWLLAAALGLLFKEDALLLVPVALLLRRSRKTLLAGAALAAGYWAVRWLLLRHLGVVVEGHATQWRHSDLALWRDYARALETFATPLFSGWKGFSLAGAALGAAAAWLLPAEADGRRRRELLTLAAVLFFAGIWPYAAFENGLSDVQRAARSVAGLCVLLALPAAALARRARWAWIGAFALLAGHTAAAYRAPDPRLLPFLSAYMHRETARSEAAAAEVLGAQWRAGDHALFKGFHNLRVGALYASRAGARLPSFDWSEWRQDQKTAPTRGARLWLVERFWVSPERTRLLITRYPDGRSWPFEWTD